MSKSKLYSKAEDVVAYRPKPTLSLDAKDLPAIKDWAVGKTYEVTVKAKLVFMSEGDEYGDYEGEGKERRKTQRARFRIVSVKESTKK
jgi:hypothetical protein